MLKFLIPTVAAALLYKYGQSVSEAADRLIYSYKGSHWDLHILKPAFVHVTLTIENPTRTALFFDRIDLTAKRNESPLGTVVMEKRTMIPANGKTEVTFPFRLNGKNIVLQIIDAIRRKSAGKLFVTGNIVAGIVKVPIDIEQDLSKLEL